MGDHLKDQKGDDKTENTNDDDDDMVQHNSEDEDKEDTEASNPNSATVQTKNYSTIGMVSQENFNELLHIFPDIKKNLSDSLVQY